MNTRRNLAAWTALVAPALLIGCAASTTAPTTIAQAGAKIIAVAQAAITSILNVVSIAGVTLTSDTQAIVTTAQNGLTALGSALAGVTSTTAASGASTASQTWSLILSAANAVLGVLPVTSQFVGAANTIKAVLALDPLFQALLAELTGGAAPAVQASVKPGHLLGVMGE